MLVAPLWFKVNCLHCEILTNLRCKYISKIFRNIKTHFILLDKKKFCEKCIYIYIYIYILINLNKKADMKEGHNASNITNDDYIHENGEAANTEESPAKQKLRGWLNRNLRIKMTDGRVLIGAFLCTDRDANVILGSCSEFLSEDHTEARTLGLVMIPGRHIVTIHLDA